MKIHRAGYKIIILFVMFVVVVNALAVTILSNLYLLGAIALATLLVLIFILRFFRVPNRENIGDELTIVAPADGKVVAIEEAFEDEFLQTKALQVSIFMSVWNVHINWFPVQGVMKKYKYHPGKFLVARHPKSSTLNERTSVLMETNQKTPIVIRQIAGIVARRIENYVKSDNISVAAGQEMGFIKFGSRVDVFLPLNSDLKVSIGQKVRGKITQVAQLPDIGHVS